MKRKTFTKDIEAPRSIVWKILWNPRTYEKWCTAFSPGSTIVTDWKEGSRLLFLDVNGDGIIYEIAERKDLEKISLRHSGRLVDGKEDTESEKVKGWIGSYHKYTLEEIPNGTRLSIELVYDEAYEVFFEKNWNRALDHIKSISESADTFSLHQMVNLVL